MDDELDRSNQSHKLHDEVPNAREDSDYAERTTDICNANLDLYLEILQAKLTEQNPSLKDEIDLKIELLRNLTPPKPHTDFINYGGKLMIRNLYNEGNPIRVTQIARTIYHIDKNLGQLDYLDRLFPPGFSHNPKTKKSLYQPDRNYFPGLSSRFNTILESGNWDIFNPLIQIFALRFFVQIPKKLAIERSQGLLDLISQNTYSFESKSNIDTFFNRIEGQFLTILNDLQTIDRCMNNISSIAYENGYNKDKKQLLFEMAFVSKRGFSNIAEFYTAYMPIIHLIEKGDWAEAFKHRDFLLRYFTHSFPQWKHDQFAAQQQEPSFNTIKDVVDAIRAGNLNLSYDNIPSQYVYIFENIIPKKILKANILEKNTIIKSSIPLSYAILRALSTSSTKYRIELTHDRTINITDVHWKYPGQVATHNTKVHGRQTTSSLGKILYMCLSNIKRQEDKVTPENRYKTIADRKRYKQLTLNDARGMLTRGYNNYKAMDSTINYSLKDYLSLMIGSYQELPPEDPIAQFIESL